MPTTTTSVGALGGPKSETDLEILLARSITLGQQTLHDITRRALLRLLHYPYHVNFTGNLFALHELFQLMETLATVRSAGDLLARLLVREYQEKVEDVEEGQEPLQEAFDESEHPRGKDGRFIDHADLSRAATDPEFREKLRADVRDEDKGKFDAAVEDKGVAKPKAATAWTASREEWEKAGMPYPDYEKLPNTLQAEAQGIKDFLGLFADPVAAARTGEIEPAPSTYAKTRDKEFAEKIGQMPSFKSKTPLVSRLKKLGAPSNGEDARVAIANGRRLGYRDEDIAAYIFNNYIPGGDKILAGGKVPPAVAAFLKEK